MPDKYYFEKLMIMGVIFLFMPFLILGFPTTKKKEVQDVPDHVTVQASEHKQADASRISLVSYKG